MPKSQPGQFLHPDLLRSLSNIELKARVLVEGMYASRHRSPFYGQSVEFVDHREYSPGDEPKRIDWKMLARTEKYFVKRFEMESNMNVVVLLDTSGSMGYEPTDDARLGKLTYGSYLGAALAFLVNRQQDAAGLVTFDSEVQSFVPPQQGERHLRTIFSCLEDIQPGGDTDVSEVIGTVAERLPGRGIVVLISDCYGEPEVSVEGVRHLVVRGQDVIVFHLLDHDEVTFPFKALTSFRDMESGQEVMSDPLKQRQEYLQRLEEFRRDMRDGVTGAGGDYRFIDTVEPLETVLRDYLLHRRQTMRRG
jgi:uncharacterized protein (DUF58 family)